MADHKHSAAYRSCQAKIKDLPAKGTCGKLLCPFVSGSLEIMMGDNNVNLQVVQALQAITI